jgi:hypothetical protein
VSRTTPLAVAAASSTSAVAASVASYMASLTLAAAFSRARSAGRRDSRQEHTRMLMITQESARGGSR